MKKSALQRIFFSLRFKFLISFPVFAQDNFNVKGKVTHEGNCALEGTIHTKETNNTFRPRPNTFLVPLTDQNDKAFDGAARAA